MRAYRQAQVRTADAEALIADASTEAEIRNMAEEERAELKTELEKLDPANALFWRFNMRRLNAEEVRDSVLAASGRLNLKAGGPSVFPKIPREVLHGQSMPGSSAAISSS